LKKRSKKLLLISLGAKGNSEPGEKSFLVLFFKKEHLSSCGWPGVCPLAIGFTSLLN
jgi:hypothetical protein